MNREDYYSRMYDLFVALHPAIDNMQASYWEMNQWKEAATKDMVENIEEAEANMEVDE